MPEPICGAEPTSRPGRFRRYADRRVALMLALGFSSGLPLLLVLGTFSARLAFANVDVRAIGLFSYLALPYSLKFLWSPAVDKLDPPLLGRWLGRRRAWMVVAQVAVALSLGLMAFAAPDTSLGLLGLGAFLVALSAATQDVVIDGWRIDAAGTEMQGVMAATSNLGYRIALVTAGAGALYLADALGWRTAYLTMAGLMIVGLAAALLAPAGLPESGGEPATPSPPRAWSFGRGISDPLRDLHDRFGGRLWPILVAVALYRMPDFVSGVMANPLYRALGFGLSDIATVSKLYGIWVGIFASFVSGWTIARFGLFPAFVTGAALAAGSHLSLAWLAAGPPELWRLIVAISIDNFGGSFAGTALIAYMSGLCAPAFAATQYALFSSLYALPGKLVAGSSGFIVAAFGFPAFFLLTAAIGIPVVLLCLLVGRTGRGGATPVASPATAREDRVTPAGTT